MGLQVRAVRMARTMKVAKVKAQEERVPRGMDRPGCFSSPDRFAPAMIPARSNILKFVEIFRHIKI